MNLTVNRMCFACGESNPIGLRLRFRQEGERYVTGFRPGEQHQGYAGIVHGGIISTLLDEAMARMLWAQGRPALTADFQVRFRRGVKVGEELTVRAWVASEKRRLICTEAEVVDSRDEPVAWAKATFLVEQQRAE